MPTIPTVLGPVFVDGQGGAGQPVGQPVALPWPSMFTDHRMWRHQTAALQAAGWRTLALDPPGHGQSKGSGRSFTMDDRAEVAIHVLDATGIDGPVAYLGTSWGGFVAARLALRAPERVSGMVLFNTSAERGTSFERMRARALTKLLAIGPLDELTGGMIMSGLLAPTIRRRSPETGARLTEQLLGWDRRALIAAVRSVHVDRSAVLDALDNLQTPTLVVSGAEDRTLPTIHSRRLVEKLPHARLVVVPGAAHLVPLEQPEAANALIAEFLRQNPPN